MSDHLIKFLLPSRSRPEKFFETLDNVTQHCSNDNYGIVALLDADDPTMNNAAVIGRMQDYPKLKFHYATQTTGKVSAINFGLTCLKKYDILVLIADDIRFTAIGFDSEIRCDMEKYFPKLNGLLHYPDDIPQSGEKQVTMPVMGRLLVEHFGYIYHPSYFSLWCDTEQINVVKKLGKHKYIPNHFYQHLHPAFGRGVADALHNTNESYYYQDQDNFFKRLNENFPL